jgi:hypothetical protein
MSSQPNSQPDEAERSNFVVELFREPGEPGRAQFSCSLRDWNFFRDLGKTFGWHPVGTTYLPQQGERARDKPIKHDYHPGDTRDRKRIESNDCAQWAAALEGARRTPFFADMLRTHAQLQAPGDANAEPALQSLLQNFIDFARRGAFTISLRPEHASDSSNADAPPHNRGGRSIRGAPDAPVPGSNR